MKSLLQIGFNGKQTGRLVLVAAFVLLIAASGFAEEKEMVLLWEDGAPGAMGDTDKDIPAIILYPADQNTANGAAVVVCPGGGYGGLAMNHEGHDVARWLNSHGISAFILRYRVSPYRHPIPLGDAQRAIRTVRSRADEWGVDPSRIGILGFSAGGHLTSSAATHFDHGDPNASDPIEHASCRPDFAVLVYPVITLTDERYTHVGSRNNLLGKDADPELMKLMSNELQVTKDTPPTFLMHTSNDTGVPAENSILFYLALRKAGVPAEMHIYEKGQHGFGLAPNDPELSNWPDRCIAWFRFRGFLGDSGG